MSYTEILEISERLKRTSHRVKNSGDIDLAELGLKIARKVKKQSTLIHAKTIEEEYLSFLKEKYSPILPIDKLPPRIKNISGYVDPASDDNTPEIQLTDKTGAENENNNTDATEDNSFDVNSAIDKLNDNVETTYTGNCATYVREALEDGGIDTSGHPKDAKDYGPFLEQKGFNSVDNSEIDDPQKGDIVVIEANEVHPSGHIAMFNGEKWVSDTKQRNYSAGIHSEFKLYRHE